MLGKVVVEGVEPESVPFDDPNTRNLVAEVSSKVCVWLWLVDVLVCFLSKLKACFLLEIIMFLLQCRDYSGYVMYILPVLPPLVECNTVQWKCTGQSAAIHLMQDYLDFLHQEKFRKSSFQIGIPPVGTCQNCLRVGCRNSRTLT